MSNRWDETWHRLREWTNGQGPSERLAAQILIHENYQGIDPSHPLGGKDGMKDARCQKDDRRWLMAVYFPRGQQDFDDIKKKFVADLKGVRTNKADAMAFVTNQELRLAERNTLQKAAGTVSVELFHLERITAILDKPDMASIRKQFLGIDFTQEALQQETTSVKVTSVNQMGGITAYSVNVHNKPQKRSLKQSWSTIVGELQKHSITAYRLHYSTNDPEANELENEIDRILAEVKWQRIHPIQRLGGPQLPEGVTVFMLKPIEPMVTLVNQLWIALDRRGVEGHVVQDLDNIFKIQGWPPIELQSTVCGVVIFIGPNSEN